MELLRELTRLQDELGWLSNDTLRQLATERRLPLYRLEGLVSFYPHFRRSPPKRAEVHICRDVVCAMHGSDDCRARLKERLGGDVELHEVSCLGRCDSAPAVAINDVSIAPTSLAETDAVLSLIDDTSALPTPVPTTTPRTWRCDPYSSPADRYETVRSLVASPVLIGETCVGYLKESGLRGMGGAGFPTGMKWELVAQEEATPKYVICNADESEPGTFKDRVILEELPHLVIEGMLLAGLTTGAEQGIIYIRHEYVKERMALERELVRARDTGVLGSDAAGSGRAFDIEIFVSPGGYILGEETALLEALEDKRGEPRNKPPYPVQHGLWGKPTLINNVESFALATSIVHHGPTWWKEQGADGCGGLKFVCISGDITEPGVYEIPVGTPVSGLIEQAGGIVDGKALKAFLPGGASTDFLPASAVDTPQDFDAMKQAGSALGTGAVIVFAEGRDLFSLATNLVRFFRNESCGKCVPCRIGSEQAVRTLEAVSEGEAGPQVLEELPQLGDTLLQTSICGLGQVALVPILSMLRHFPEEAPDGSAP